MFHFQNWKKNCYRLIIMKYHCPKTANHHQWIAMFLSILALMLVYCGPITVKHHQWITVSFHFCNFASLLRLKNCKPVLKSRQRSKKIWNDSSKNERRKWHLLTNMSIKGCLWRWLTAPLVHKTRFSLKTGFFTKQKKNLIK